VLPAVLVAPTFPGRRACRWPALLPMHATPAHCSSQSRRRCAMGSDTWPTMRLYPRAGLQHGAHDAIHGAPQLSRDCDCVPRVVLGRTCCAVRACASRDVAGRDAGTLREGQQVCTVYALSQRPAPAALVHCGQHELPPRACSHRGCSTCRAGPTAMSCRSAQVAPAVPGGECVLKLQDSIPASASHNVRHPQRV
jgi:hypothetical protein